jgi:hypothetical protein
LIAASAALNPAFHAPFDLVAIVQVPVTAVIDAVGAVVKSFVTSVKAVVAPLCPIFPPVFAGIDSRIRISLYSATCVGIDLNTARIHVHPAAAIGILSNSHVRSRRRDASSAGVNIHIRLLSVCPAGYGENQRRRR